MSKSHRSSLADRIRRLPNFDFGTELAALEAQHADGLPLLLAIIDAKIRPKDEACRLFADTLGVAYVDPFASVITDEAVAAIPVEIARKAREVKGCSRSSHRIRKLQRRPRRSSRAMTGRPEREPRTRRVVVTAEACFGIEAPLRRATDSVALRYV